MTGEELPTTIVCFIGGVTFAEISALRLVNRQLPSKLAALVFVPARWQPLTFRPLLTPHLAHSPQLAHRHHGYGDGLVAAVVADAGTLASIRNVWCRTHLVMIAIRIISRNERNGSLFLLAAGRRRDDRIRC